MAASQFIAGLLGPVLAVSGVGFLANGPSYNHLVRETLEGVTFIYLFGLLGMVAGLAIIRLHNFWVRDWRLLVTLMGWLIPGQISFDLSGQVSARGVGGAAARKQRLIPAHRQQIEESKLRWAGMMTIGGAIRMLVPRAVANLGTALWGHNWFLPMIGILLLALGGSLSFQAYRR